MSIVVKAAVRVYLTIPLVLVLAAFGLWNWAWLVLGLATFSEVIPLAWSHHARTLKKSTT